METAMNKLVLPAALAGLALVAGACGHDDHLTPAEDACEHIGDAPVSLTAAEAGAAAPRVSEGHTRYEITLVGEAGSKGGRVDLVVAEAGDVHLFFSQAIPLALEDGQGQPVAAESSRADVTECAGVSTEHVFDLGVGTYALALGPTALDTVSLLLVFDDGHGH
jgi:hypothetical protein